MSKAESFLNQITSRIRKSGAFPGVDDDCIQSIAEAATWFSVRGGNTLFAQGDPSDALYITVSGLLVAGGILLRFRGGKSRVCWSGKLRRGDGHERHAHNGRNHH